MNYSKIFPKSIHNYSEKYGKRRITDENFVFLNEGFGIRKFNEFGFSGDENISIFKTKKTFRIGLIGDSFIESLQVFERQYFGNILKEKLEKLYPNFKFEILNFGKSGSDLGDMYVTYKEYVEILNPDLVLFFISNVDLKAERREPISPILVLKNDSLKIANSFNRTLVENKMKLNEICKNSCIGNLVYSAFSNLKIKNQSVKIVNLINKFFTNNKKSIKQQQPRANSNPTDSIAIQITKNLKNANTYIVNRGTKNLNDDFSNLCKRLGLKTFKLFDTSFSEFSSYSYWKNAKMQGHWNYEGHKYVAKKILEQIRMDSLIENHFGKSNFQ